jgi:predicted esterase
MTLPHAETPTIRGGQPLDSAKVAVVLLHGRGASAESILDLGHALEIEEAALLAPQAEGSSWYPYSFLAPLTGNEPFLSGALARIGRLVAEIEQAGISRDRIVLIGFSQGACLALEFLARSGEPLGAIVALSGGLIGNVDLPEQALPDDKGFNYEADLTGCPVFLGCSDIDAHIPLARVKQSADIFVGLGAEVDARIYPGMGHTVNADELRAARDLVSAIV